MSDELSTIREFITNNDIPLIGNIIKDSQPGNHYFAVVSITRNSDGSQHPSNKLLKKVQISLCNEGYNINFIFNDLQTVDIEAGLRAALMLAHRNTIISLTLVVTGKNATVWIELADSHVKKIKIADIQKKTETYLASFSINEVTIQFISKTNLPSTLACLSMIRRLAPVSADQLRDALQSKGFNLPSPDWLAHRLDLLRKRGRIVRLRNGSYTLTASALQQLGTTKMKTSPDVARMLALARRSR